MDEKKLNELAQISVLHNNLSFEMQNTIQTLIRLGISEANDIQKSLQESINTLKRIFNKKYADIDLDTQLTLLKAGFGLREYK